MLCIRLLIAIVNFIAIMSAVRIEAFCWGAGSSLEELLPYFMGRADRLSESYPESRCALAMK